MVERFRVIWGYYGTPITENQMDKRMENEMEAGVIYTGYIGDIVFYLGMLWSQI